MRPVTALGGDAAVDVKIGTYRIAERFDVALASVAVRRGRDADVAFAATAAGLPLPAPARAASLERFGAFWVTPEMWFVEAPMVVHDDLARDLKTIFSDAASVTEQTDAWVRFDVSALDLSPLFERLSNVDLAAAPVGFASRTVLSDQAGGGRGDPLWAAIFRGEPFACAGGGGNVGCLKRKALYL